MSYIKKVYDKRAILRDLAESAVAMLEKDWEERDRADIQSGLEPWEDTVEARKELVEHIQKLLQQ